MTNRISKRVSFSESENVVTEISSRPKSSKRSSILPIMAQSMTLPEAFDLAVVFEDLADKLDVVGRSISAKEADIKPKDSFTSIHDQKASLKIGIATKEKSCHRILSEHYRKLNTRPDSSAKELNRNLQKNNSPRKSLQQRMSLMMEEFFIKDLTNMAKTQSDRMYLENVVNNVMEGLVQTSSFDALDEMIFEQNEIKEEMIQCVQKGLDMDEKRRHLKAQIALERKIKAQQLAAMDRTIWTLEDQSQEVKQRSKTQSSYITAQAKMIKSKSKKICFVKDSAMLEKAKNAKNSIILEHRAHHSMMDIIQKKLEDREQQVEFWQDKYHTDIIRIRGDIELLLIDREQTQQRTAALREKIRRLERDVNDQRRIKRKLDKEIGRGVREQWAALKIQKVWRGYMVRELGMY